MKVKIEVPSEFSKLYHDLRKEGYRGVDAAYVLTTHFIDEMIKMNNKSKTK